MSNGLILFKQAQHNEEIQVLREDVSALSQLIEERDLRLKDTQAAQSSERQLALVRNIRPSSMFLTNEHVLSKHKKVSRNIPREMHCGNNDKYLYEYGLAFAGTRPRGGEIKGNIGSP